MSCWSRGFPGGGLLLHGNSWAWGKVGSNVPISRPPRDVVGQIMELTRVCKVKVPQRHSGGRTQRGFGGSKAGYESGLGDMRSLWFGASFKASPSLGFLICQNGNICTWPNADAGKALGDPSVKFLRGIVNMPYYTFKKTQVQALIASLKMSWLLCAGYKRLHVHSNHQRDSRDKSDQRLLDVSHMLSND